MNLQGPWTRFRERSSALRARLEPVWTGLKPVWTRLKLDLVVRAAVVVGGFGVLAVAAEAAFRARIHSPASRVPSAIYTRPQAWGAGGGSGAPIPIGTVGGGAIEFRMPVSLSKVPDHLADAVLAVEDQRFHSHNGLDFRRVVGAFLANVKAGQISQGGSTITQQLAKNLFLSADRTPIRKLREWAMASVLEANYDKSTILEAYLNEIYLGQDGSRPIHGVGAAARYYFGKDVGKISVAESALLAGMIQAPNRFSPIRNSRTARKRRDLVLGLMAEQERISRKAADKAARTRIGTRAHPSPSLDARYFRDFAGAALPGGVPSRGAAVYTTLDPALQRAAARAVEEGVARLRVPDVQAALVAIDPRSGDVLAMVGGRDYGTSQFNRAATAFRQPGSAFKPIVALAALHRDGNRAPAFTLASRIEDEPLSVTTSSGRWEPTNYDRSFRGEVTFREAIEQSLNVPFARIGLAVGPERIVATGRRLGITSPLRAVPSLALGSSEVTLLEMVRAYGVFATGGRLATTRTVLGRAEAGAPRPTGEPPELEPVVDPAEAYLITSALEGVIERGTGRALGGRGRFASIAGKTGTSNDWRDAWFIAYSPTLVVGVWVGFDDGRSLRLNGSAAALPIVARFLDRVDPRDGGASFPVPEGIEVAQVAGGSGWAWDCGEREVFLEGTAPESDCSGRDYFDWDDEDRGLERWRDRLESRGRRVVNELIARLLERAEAQRKEARRWTQ